MLIKAGFGNLTDWAVRQGEGLLNQNFHPKILSKIMPYVFNYAAGGFEFESNEQRERRRWMPLVGKSEEVTTRPKRSRVIGWRQVYAFAFDKNVLNITCVWFSQQY